MTTVGTRGESGAGWASGERKAQRERRGPPATARSPQRRPGARSPHCRGILRGMWRGGSRGRSGGGGRRGWQSWAATSSKEEEKGTAARTQPFRDLVHRAVRPQDRRPEIVKDRWRRMLGEALPGVQLDSPREKGRRPRVQMLTELLPRGRVHPAVPSLTTTTLRATHPATSSHATTPPMAEGLGFTGMPYSTYGVTPAVTAPPMVTTVGEPVDSSSTYTGICESVPRRYDDDYHRPATAVYLTGIPGYAAPEPGYPMPAPCFTSSKKKSLPCPSWRP